MPCFPDGLINMQGNLVTRPGLQMKLGNFRYNQTREKRPQWEEISAKASQNKFSTMGGGRRVRDTWSVGVFGFVF